MTALQLNILCNKDERDDEDIRLQDQLKEMGVVPTNDTSKITQEWRLGYVIAEQIEAFYPSGKHPQHTMIHMTSGNIITIRESQTELLTILVPPSLPRPLTHETIDSNGKRIYNYPASISDVQQ